MSTSLNTMTMSSKLPSPKPDSRPWHEAYRDKLLDPRNLEQAVATLRARGLRIVTINGSFDLLHAGHLFILFEASKCADRLIVALNSDASVKSYKGPMRPFIRLEERLQLVAALNFVDYVTYFDEPDPRELLKRIRPDVHANGEEYGSHCIEKEVVEEGGGRLQLIKRIDGLATSDIAKRIRCALSAP